MKYKSDSVFSYSILRTVKMNVKAGYDNFYLYMFSYPEYGSDIEEANHCAQARAVRDEDKKNLTEEYRRVKALIREIWYNFMLTGNPVINGTPAISPHLSVGRNMELRGPLMQERAQFWDDIYERH